MNTLTKSVLVIFSVLTLLASGNAQSPEPTALRRFNIRFLRGRFVVGPATNPDLQCRRTFFSPVQPSTVRVAIASVTNDGVKTIPTEADIAEFEQVDGTGLFRAGEAEVRIILRGPVFRGRYVYIVVSDGTNIITEISNRRLFRRFFRRRVIRFIRRFGVTNIRNLARNRKCLRMLPRKFIFPAPVVPSPEMEIPEAS